VQFRDVQLPNTCLVTDHKVHDNFHENPSMNPEVG